MHLSFWLVWRATFIREDIPYLIAGMCSRRSDCALRATLTIWSSVKRNLPSCFCKPEKTDDILSDCDVLMVLIEKNGKSMRAFY